MCLHTSELSAAFQPFPSSLCLSVQACHPRSPWGALSILRKLWSGGDVLGGVTLHPDRHPSPRPAQPRVTLASEALLVQDRVSLPGFSLCVIFFLFGEVLQDFGLLIFIHNSFCRVVIPKGTARSQQTMQKAEWHNGQTKQNLRAKVPPAPSRTRGLLHVSFLCRYFYIHSLLCWRERDVGSTCSAVAPRPLSAELLSHQVTLPVWVWTLPLKLELCTCLVNGILFIAVPVPHMPRSYWKFKQGDLQHIFHSS